MNDSELLEFAAKAAGISLFVWGAKGAENYRIKNADYTPGNPWNPLKDDGDALRLAVMLQLLIDSHGLLVRVGLPFASYLVIEEKGHDPCATTRRAIVRAAAEIGKQL